MAIYPAGRLFVAKGKNSPNSSIMKLESGANTADSSTSNSTGSSTIICLFNALFICTSQKSTKTLLGWKKNMSNNLLSKKMLQNSLKQAICCHGCGK